MANCSICDTANTPVEPDGMRSIVHCVGCGKYVAICHEQYIPKALYRDQAYRRDARVLPHTRRPGMVGTRPTENVIARICELLDLAARLRSASAQWIRG